MATINGTNGTDTITPGITSGGVTGGPVTNTGDAINGLDGGDVIIGGTGNDSIDGGAGNDILSGGLGNDSILGGDGNDTLNGNDGNDTLDGGLGADAFDGGLGIDEVSYASFGGGGLVANLASPALNTLAAIGDTYLSIETLRGTGGNDTLTGDRLANTLQGDVGNDLLSGGAGNDNLFGAAGDDTLDGGTGADILGGGGGNDTYLVDSLGDAIQESSGTVDTEYTLINLTLAAGIEIGRLAGSADTLTADVASFAPVQLVGNPNAASNLFGGGGDDVLYNISEGGILYGRLGADTLRDQGYSAALLGGDGNDSYVVNNINSTIQEDIGEGIDTLYLGVNGYVVATGVEITRLGGSATQVYGSNDAEQLVANSLFASSLDGQGGNDVLWGSAFADIMSGSAGDDILRGQGGADQMFGGTGNDQFVCFSAGCTITEAAGAGYDIVYFDGAGNLFIGNNVEEGRLAGSGTALTGNAGANLLVGNSSGVASTLYGGGGDDIIFGSTSGDLIYGQGGNDTMYSQGGPDRFAYEGTGWGVDQIAGFSQAAGAKLYFTGSGIGFNQLTLSFGGGNTQVTMGADIILVFGATLTVNDFLF